MNVSCIWTIVLLVVACPVLGARTLRQVAIPDTQDLKNEIQLSQDQIRNLETSTTRIKDDVVDIRAEIKDLRKELRDEAREQRLSQSRNTQTIIGVTSFLLAVVSLLMAYLTKKGQAKFDPPAAIEARSVYEMLTLLKIAGVIEEAQFESMWRRVYQKFGALAKQSE